ncbi:MAG TPA: 6-phosphogluconolactonase [Pyrinomonadaceae bacterium]
MTFDIHISANAQELSRFAAEQFVLRAIEAQREKELFTVVLAGGSTPKTLYELLANENEPYRGQLCWEKIHFFWGDERHVPPDDSDSNYRMAFETMLARVPVPSNNMHRIRSEIGDAGEAANEYEETLVQFFRLGKGQLPCFDLVLLGMGSDGHTASIFPNSDVINEKERLVVAPWIEKLKSYRITLTPPVLNNADSVIFLVSGAEKANALREILEGDYLPECFPAQVVRPITGNTLWLADLEAAQLLNQNLS